MQNHTILHSSSNSTQLETASDDINRDKESKGRKMRELAESTQKKLEFANKLIAQAQDIAEPWNVSKNLINDLLAPAKEVINLVDAIAAIHPAVQVLVGVVKVVVSMALQRLENDKRIAVVYSTMVNLLLLLSDLDPAFDEGTLRRALEELLVTVRSTISEFGNFCEVYYKQMSFVRSLQSAKYKDKLASFAELFASHKEDVYNLMTSKTALMVMDVRVDVSQVLKLLESSDKREKRVLELIENLGGYEKVIQNDKKIEELAEKLSEKYNASARRALKTDLENALKQNHIAFGVKIDLSTQQIQGSIDTSTTTILTKLDQGPHELIEDPDIRIVWKDMQSRTSAKTRIFLDAVYNHFLRKFTEYTLDKETRHPDAWTLTFLSNLVFYPAISEGIDGDSSGFVSVHEVNQFLKSKPNDLNCSSVAWIALWAVGPCKTNAEHSEKIQSMLEALMCASNDLTYNKKGILFFQAIAKNLRLIHVHDDIHERLEDLENESEDYQSLLKLQVTWRHLEMKRVKNSLDELRYQLNGPDYIPFLLSGRSLEHSVLCLCYLLLRRHMKIVKLARERAISIFEFEDMRDAWDLIFAAFKKRFSVLKQIWRQQRMDVATHVNGYAGGLFASWYERDEARLDASTDDEPEYDDDDDDDDYSYSEDEFLESEINDPNDDEGSPNTLGVEDEDELTAPALPRPVSVASKTSAVTAQDSPDTLLSYFIPDEPEDEDGFSTDEESVWEPAPVRKRNAENRLKKRLDGMDSRLNLMDEKLESIQGMLKKFLTLQHPSAQPTLTKEQPSISRVTNNPDLSQVVASSAYALNDGNHLYDIGIENGHGGDHQHLIDGGQNNGSGEDDHEVKGEECDDTNHLGGSDPESD